LSWVGALALVSCPVAALLVPLLVPGNRAGTIAYLVSVLLSALFVMNAVFRVPVARRGPWRAMFAMMALYGVEDAEALLHAADEALYEAKRSGRDRLVLAADLDAGLPDPKQGVA
jgi:predicted signal transduction protein with EAL and GGDEF domain